MLRRRRHRGARPSASLRRRWLTAALAPLVVLCAAEAVCRGLGLGAPTLEDDPSRGFIGTRSILEPTSDRAAGAGLAVLGPDNAFDRRPQFNPQFVRLARDPGEIRIAIVGGSLVYGWPYDDRVSFPRLLEAGLREALAPRPVRVVNLGAPGWGTARLSRLARDLVRLRPDVVVVASGNNEWIERREREAVFGRRAVAVRALTAAVRLSRVVALLHEAAAGARNPIEPLDPAAGGARLAPGEREAMVSDFEARVRAIAAAMHAAGVRVVVATLPVNARQCPPFLADAPGEPDGPHDAVLLALWSRALGAASRGDASGAARALDVLERRMPRGARVAYARARTLEALGRVREARAEYERAIELDDVPLRAFPSLNDAVRRIAGTSEGIALADLESAAARRSDGAVPGLDLFLDSCHVNRRGAAVLAEALAEALASAGVVILDPDWRAPFREGVSRHLETARIPEEVASSARRYLAWYYRVLQPDPELGRRILDDRSSLPALVAARP